MAMTHFSGWGATSKVLSATALTSTATRFTVTGPIRVYALGVLVRTATPAGANTLKFSFTPSGGTATDLSGATDTASCSAQQLFMVNGTKATGLVKMTDVGIRAAGQADTSMPIDLGSGVIQTIFSGGPPATGAMEVFMLWEPLGKNSRVV